MGPAAREGVLLRLPPHAHWSLRQAQGYNLGEGGLGDPRWPCHLHGNQWHPEQGSAMGSTDPRPPADLTIAGSRGRVDSPPGDSRA